MGPLIKNNGMVYPGMADATLGVGSCTPADWMYNSIFLPHTVGLAIKTG
tara:strand:- start:271 stop:417 length:147 start_codon:yes stop_codon:yes gene_type:complete